MPDKLKAECPACRKAFLAKPELAGREVDCPSCGQKMTVPRSGAPEASSTNRKASRFPIAWVALVLIATAGGVAAGAYLAQPTVAPQIQSTGNTGQQLPRPAPDEGITPAGNELVASLRKRIAALEAAAAKPKGADVDRLAQLMGIVRQEHAARRIPPELLEIEAALLGVKRGGHAHFAHLHGMFDLGLSREAVEESLTKKRFRIRDREDFSNGATGEGHAFVAGSQVSVSLYGTWNNLFGALIFSPATTEDGIVDWAMASSQIATLATGEIGLEDSPTVVYMADLAKQAIASKRTVAEVRDNGKPVRIEVSSDPSDGSLSCRVFAVQSPLTAASR